MLQVGFRSRRLTCTKDPCACAQVAGGDWSVEARRVTLQASVSAALPGCWVRAEADLACMQASAAPSAPRPAPTHFPLQPCRQLDLLQVVRAP